MAKIYEVITLQKKVGCGELNCIFEEDEGAFKKLRIKLDGPKEFIKCPHCDKEIEGEFRNCEDIWFDIAAKIITFGLRRGIWEGTIERGLIKHLKNEISKCRRYTPNKDHICNCPDAIGKMIEKYAIMRNLINPAKK